MASEFGILSPRGLGMWRMSKVGVDFSWRFLILGKKFLVKICLHIYKPLLSLPNKNSKVAVRRVLAAAVDDWLENLFALAPVQAYAYVQ